MHPIEFKLKHKIEFDPIWQVRLMMQRTGPDEILATLKYLPQIYEAYPDAFKENMKCNDLDYIDEAIRGSTRHNNSFYPRWAAYEEKHDNLFIQAMIDHSYDIADFLIGIGYRLEDYDAYNAAYTKKYEEWQEQESIKQKALEAKTRKENEDWRNKSDHLQAVLELKTPRLLSSIWEAFYMFCLVASAFHLIVPVKYAWLGTVQLGFVISVAVGITASRMYDRFLAK